MPAITCSCADGWSRACWAAKWQKQGWLSEIDLRRITCAIQNMRMLCNSTFLYDKQTHHSPKLAEFREIIRELTVEEERKVVVFSEYERMTRLAGEEFRADVLLRDAETDIVASAGGTGGAAEHRRHARIGIGAPNSSSRQGDGSAPTSRSGRPWSTSSGRSPMKTGATAASGRIMSRPWTTC